MSQPPPPPSQPPSGGFGAPQDPPPDGYGYPQQPPPGGYGYPQQPGGPPQPPQQPPGPPTPPPGGYGYPPQQPGPSGAPTQPAGYGYPAPQQGPYANTMPGNYPQVPGPGVPGGPGGSGGNNNKIIAIVAAAVAVVLIVGAGVFFLTKDDGGKDEAKGGGGSSQGTQGGGADPNKPPKNVDAKQIVSLDAPKVKDVTSMVGAWSTGKTFAKSGLNEIISTDLTSKKVTKIPLKGGVCAASRDMTKDHKVAVVAGQTISSDADCTRMVIVDLDKKKVVWEATMPNADTRNIENVTISGDTVASAWIGGSVGYKISNKKRLWKATPSTCRDVGYAGGKSLVAVVECGDLDTPQITVQKLDPDTGKAQKKFEVPKGAKNVRVASTEPLVIVTGAGDELTSDVMTVTSDYKLKTRIPIGKRYNRPCDLDVDSCYAMAVSNDTVYLSTAEHQGQADYGRTNEIMAIDFNTGNTKWKSEAGEKRSIIPIKLQGQNVVGYKLPSYDSGGEVVTIEPKKGKQTTLLKMPPSDTGKGEQAINVSTYSVDQPIIFDHGRLFLHDGLISEPRPTDDEAPKLAVGFGAQ